MVIRMDSIGDFQPPKLKKLVNTQGSEQIACADELSGANRTNNIRTDAQKKLDKIKASNGFTYKEARKTMQEIESKYREMGGDTSFGGNPYFKKVQDHSPKGPNGEEYQIYRFHYEIDVNKLPEPDKTNYKRAQAAVEEIERNNSALVADAGPRLINITF